ncbi:MAG: imidazole glycerol phosphate synthase subunit HisF [Cyanobacteria bacterium SZAS-4]|nr:imidazole glycerol phosphate synthase subunit HisF [Cyanobacteria bacterium SZAS-4]
MMSLNGLCKRIIPCLDVANGRTVKGVKFQNLRDIGDPVELGFEYQKQGADELMFLDITASKEDRSTVFDLVRDVAHKLSIPFTVGGGISSIKDVRKLLELGADKVSINTSAVNRPELIEEIATACGSQCCVVAIDARKRTNTFNGSVWEVLTKGGSVATGMDAMQWAEECVRRGAGEIMLTSWDADGTQEGFDLEMVKAFSKLPIPVIASGGAKDPQSFVDVFSTGRADAALAASIFHDGIFTINQVKTQLNQEGIPVRLC